VGWQDRELPIEPARPDFASRAPSPHDRAAGAELLPALCTAIAEPLSAQQREALVAVTINGSRSTSSPSGWPRRAARSTRRCTTLAGSCASSSRRRGFDVVDRRAGEGPPSAAG
jgi:hypothetical protein